MTQKQHALPPNHVFKCRECGTLWRQWWGSGKMNGSWSLAVHGSIAGKCCDNSADFHEMLEPVSAPPDTVPVNFGKPCAKLCSYCVRFNQCQFIQPDAKRAALPEERHSLTVKALQVDAQRWRMLPAFLEKYQLDYVALIMDIDEAIAEEGKGRDMNNSIPPDNVGFQERKP